MSYKNAFRILVITLLLLTKHTFSQINGFAAVSSIAGKILSIAGTNVNESFGTFQNDGFLIVMQMKGASISTSNDINFGQITAISSAGLYEIRKIKTVTRSSGVVTTIELYDNLANSYNTAGIVQVITFPSFPHNHVIGSNIQTVPWNGRIGGVTAFSVDGTLNLNANISADQAGFRRGERRGSNDGSCAPNTFVSVADSRYADKGEGIVIAATDQVAARGRLANGGGGGNVHNGGGGGGSNYTAGGNGGRGWGCSSSNEAGGLGGAALSSYISSSRVFLGGGGGGGQQNNGAGTNGGNGGGIIIIKADSIVVSAGASCNRSISANGESTANAGNDGAGGGGAGGSILLLVDGFRIANPCGLTVRANGGSGGRVSDGSIHGGGGGGGQGAVIVSNLNPPANVLLQTVPGAGGCNNNSNPCSSPAAPGSAAVNTGLIQFGPGNPLPVELIGFVGVLDGDRIRLDWATQSEKNVSHFQLYRSSDGLEWTHLSSTNAVGTTQLAVHYFAIDFEPLRGENYYQLEIIDVDGAKSYSSVVLVSALTSASEVSVFPNPTRGAFMIQHDQELDPASVVVTDLVGKQVPFVVISLNEQLKRIELEQPAEGTYLVSYASRGKQYAQRIQVIR